MNILGSKEIDDITLDLKALKIESAPTIKKETHVPKENPTQDDDKNAISDNQKHTNNSGRPQNRRWNQRYSSFGRRNRPFNRWNTRSAFARNNRSSFGRRSPDFIQRISRAPFRLRRERELDIEQITFGKKRAQLTEEERKLFNEISAKLYNHYTERIERPLTVFQDFVEERRKKNPKLQIKELKEEWAKLPDIEERKENAWKLHKKFLADYKAYEEKRLTLLNELRRLVGKPKLVMGINFLKGFEIFWNEVEGDVKAKMPEATEYELEKKRGEMWKGLAREKKGYYLTLSWIEKEKMRHRATMEKLKDQLQIAERAAPSVDSKPKPA